jgi:hypothetical protein
LSKAFQIKNIVNPVEPYLPQRAMSYALITVGGSDSHVQARRALIAII